ncbi:hypothetical protein D0Z03_002393 [Geotrichum reessii]|nr:hypothetical protein D0Z03_002393 [Galactomyces reessii]
MPTNTSSTRNPHQQHHQHHHNHTNSSGHARSASRDVPVISATAAAAAANFDASIVPLGPKATTQRRYHRDFTRSSQHYAATTPSQPRASSYLHHSGNQQRSRRGPDVASEVPADVSSASPGSTGRRKKRGAHKKKDTTEKPAVKGANSRDQQNSTVDSNTHNSVIKTDAVVTSSVSTPKLGFDQIRVSLPKASAGFDDDDDDEDGYNSSIKYRKQSSTMDGSVDSRSPSPSRSPVIRGISVTPPLMDEDNIKVATSKVAAAAATIAPITDLKVSSIGTVIVDSSIVNKNRRRFPFEDPEYYAHQLSLYFYDLTNDPAYYESRGKTAANTAVLQSSVMAATVPVLHPAVPVAIPGVAPAPGFIPAPPVSYYQAYEPYVAQTYSSGPIN